MIIYPWNKYWMFDRKILKRIFHNYFLVKRYPFLRPSCGWSVSMDYWPKGYKYRYEETWLDSIPEGWRNLALQLCEELKQIIKEDGLKNYAVHQTKEKWGVLNWYDEGGNARTFALKEKYEELSREVCLHCGKTPTTYATTKWVTYICDDCAKQLFDNNPEIVVKRKNKATI